MTPEAAGRKSRGAVSQAIPRTVSGRPDPFVHADSGERAYAYAKACGIIGKSFTGKRIAPLWHLATLAEFDRLVFPESQKELPGRELLHDLESRILGRTVRHILAVINAFSSPPPLLVRQLRACEYADLKACLHHIVAGKTNPPPLSDIGRFRTVDFDAYPDLSAMLAGTEFEFLLEKDIKKIKTAEDLSSVEAELDLRYYTLLLQSLKRLSAADRFYAAQILEAEISLRNCVWALRLRTYFDKTPEETAGYLMDIRPPKTPFWGGFGLPEAETGFRRNGTVSGKGGSLAAEARQSLQFPLDSRAAWKHWRWENLLNPAGEGGLWNANPRWFQNAASRYLYRLSLRCFRRMPFSVNSGFCYIKLKQFEEDLLTSVTEGLGLGMTGQDILSLLERPA